MTQWIWKKGDQSEALSQHNNMKIADSVSLSSYMRCNEFFQHLMVMESMTPKDPEGPEKYNNN
jgi:hypothetical protein